MTPEQIEAHIVETKQLLGKIDVKLTMLCERVRHTDKKVEALPCETHTKVMMEEVNKRVPWKIFMGIMSIVLGVILASFAYTTSVHDAVHAHKEDRVHFYSIYNSTGGDHNAIR